jgi:hypothetical protein
MRFSLNGTNFVTLHGPHGALATARHKSIELAVLRRPIEVTVLAWPDGVPPIEVAAYRRGELLRYTDPLTASRPRREDVRWDHRGHA